MSQFAISINAAILAEESSTGKLISVVRPS